MVYYAANHGTSSVLAILINPLNGILTSISGSINAKAPDLGIRGLAQFGVIDFGLLERRLLHRLGDAELQHGLGRNLDGLAGLRVAAHARLALHHHQLAHAGEHEAVLGLLGRERRAFLEGIATLLLGMFEICRGV